MNTIVTGGSGFVGSRLCSTLAEDGHDVTALSRSPEDVSLPAGVSTAAGDVTDYRSIVDAFEGQDAVVNLVALPPHFKPKGGDRMHERVHLEGTRNVIRAAKEHGVDHLVQMSALGADPDGPTAYIRAKGRAEDLVRDSGLAWTIFRPSLIFGENDEFTKFVRLTTTPYVTALPGGGQTRFQPIWVGDIVSMLAEAVVDDVHRGAIYEIGGPEVLTLANMTEVLYEAEGRSVTIIPIPMKLAGFALSVADSVPFVPFGEDQYRSLRFDNTTEDNDIDAFGRSVAGLRTFRSYINEN